MSGLKVTPLHPTFAAELSGVDFTKPVPPETYAEIRKIVDQVGGRKIVLGRNRLTLTVWCGGVPRHEVNGRGPCRVLEVFWRIGRRHAIPASG